MIDPPNAPMNAAGVDTRDAAQAITFTFPLAICLEMASVVVAELPDLGDDTRAEIAAQLASADAIRIRGDRPALPTLAGHIEALRSAVGASAPREATDAVAIARRVLTLV